MIRETHQAHPEGTVVAYSDNSSVIEGRQRARFYPGADGPLRLERGTDAHPGQGRDAQSPDGDFAFPGAATGSGGEIRDEGATGRGSKPKAGLCGFSVSNLNIPDACSLGSRSAATAARRIASALDIMLEGRSARRPSTTSSVAPTCRLFPHLRAAFTGSGAEALVRGYHKPIMLAGGVGNIAASQSFKAETFPAGTLLIQLGGPGMLIGLGGGAASSMTTGSNSEDLDFASVQRGNPEIQRRAQEVIDRCWQMGAPDGDGFAPGDGNPILSVHDVGAGGILQRAARTGARRRLRRALRAARREDRGAGMSPAEIWCNEAQERYVLAIPPAVAPGEFAAMCERERCPFRRRRRGDRR
jgi:phosphoribosylformylglycinamidine synthase